MGKALEQGDWETIRKDLDRLPIEDTDGSAKEDKIVSLLKKYGIEKKDGTVNIEIWGSGRPMREFLWSEDMADACVFIMENRDFKDCYDSDTKEIRNTHINIGTGKDISIKDLAHMIKDTVGFTGDLYFNTDKPDGTMKKLTDVSKLHDLGWQHTVGLYDGIEKVSDWYRQF